MKIGTPAEILKGEARVAMTPDSAVDLQKLGYECLIQSGAGAKADFADADYEAVGVTVLKSADSLWKSSDIVAKVRVPTETELKRLRAGQTLITFFNPSENEEGLELARSKG
ncbi:MAG TPA: NAD(P)(+) transhydrogenase (Re/Si-specific) subunit alpha, partial [Salibaculum sp.]|nr:NAD(P)(+) transhydrogenase (Re/Si-specific) subunit alpha [Salibaculum sp.]